MIHVAGIHRHLDTRCLAKVHMIIWNPKGIPTRSMENMKLMTTKHVSYPQLTATWECNKLELYLNPSVGETIIQFISFFYCSRRGVLVVSHSCFWYRPPIAGIALPSLVFIASDPCRTPQCRGRGLGL